MFPLQIRYDRRFLTMQLLVALIMLGLSIYTHNIFEFCLALVWILMGIKSYSTIAVEVTETEIILKNSFGLVSNRYKYKEAFIEIKGRYILLDNKKIYTHFFMFLTQDFKKVCEFFATQNVANNLQRHLIEEDI